MTDSASSPQPKVPAARKKRASLSWIAVLIVIPVILMGRLLLNGVLDNPLENPCTFQTRSYGDLGSDFYAPLMRFRFHSTVPRDKVLVMPLTPGSGPDQVPASVVENPCRGRRFMAGLVDRLDAHAPSVIAIDRYYDDDDRCPERSGANDALRVALSTAEVYGQVAPAAVVVGLDSGEATEQQANSNGGSCLLSEKPLNLEASQIPAGRVRRAIHFGLVQLNQDVLRIPLRWWLTAGQNQNRSAAGFALASYALASGPLSAEDQAKVDSGVPLSYYRKDLTELLNRDAHPYSFFPKKLPSEVSPVAVLCNDEKGKDFLRRYLLDIDNSEEQIRAQDGHPEEAYCQAATPLPDLSGRVVVIGVRAENTDTHPFPGGEQYGVDLQADYIEALHDNAYIRNAPAWLDYGLTLLLGILMIGREVMPEYVTSKWWVTLSYDVGVVLGAMVFSIVLLFFGYFTPVFWLACSGVVLTDIFMRLFERMTHHLREKREAHEART